MGDYAENGDYALNGDYAGLTASNPIKVLGESTQVSEALITLRSLVRVHNEGLDLSEQNLHVLPSGLVKVIAEGMSLSETSLHVVAAVVPPTTIYSFDGFDFFHPATHAFLIHNWQSPGPSAIAYPGEGVLGGMAWGFDSSNQTYERVNIPSLTTIVVGFWMKPSFSTIAVARTFMQLRSSAGDISTLTMNQIPSGSITMSGQTTASSIWTADTWDFWEARVVVSPTVGEVELRKNGVPVLSATGLNTGSNAITQLRFTGNVNMDYKFEDAYIADDFLGPVIVAQLKPVADSTPNEFTASTGTDEYAMLDDVVSDASLYAHLHDEDTTYVTSSTDTHKSVFDLANLPSVAPYTRPLAVEVYNYGRKESAVAAAYRAGIKSGSVEEFGPDNDTDLASTFYGWVNDPDTSPNFIRFFTNPDGDIPWTLTTIDALQAVIENRAAFPVRVTGLGVQVLLALPEGLSPRQVDEIVQLSESVLRVGGSLSAVSFSGWGIPL